MRILDHFGWIAPHYDRFGSERTGEELQGLIHIQPDDLVLDSGGGTGRVGYSLMQYSDKVIILDESLAMISQAKRKPGLLGLCAAAEILPFNDKGFDVIVMVDAFHHLQNQERSAAEMWRVLKPGGRILIEEPDIHRPVIKLIALAERILLMRSHFSTMEEVAALFAAYPGEKKIVRQGVNGYFLFKASTDARKITV